MCYGSGACSWWPVLRGTPRHNGDCFVSKLPFHCCFPSHPFPVSSIFLFCPPLNFHTCEHTHAQSSMHTFTDFTNMHTCEPSQMSIHHTNMHTHMAVHTIQSYMGTCTDKHIHVHKGLHTCTCTQSTEALLCFSYSGSYYLPQL